MVTKITLRSALEAIRDHAFKASPYPVILSLECHMTALSQDVAAGMFVEIMGESLLKRGEALNQTTGRLKSPEQLKGKIIIKVRTLLID